MKQIQKISEMTGFYRVFSSEPIRFGMVTGVFVPTLLTILGVIMYLRLGWVVGSVGLAGAWLIIAIAYTITTTTALSMASIISNIRIGPGGAYSIITRSLGIEIGGSIGVPLYLSLTLSVILYIFGFREGLLLIFPALSPMLIDIITFCLIFGIVFFSTDITFRLQYLILAIVIGSLLVIVGSGMSATPAFDISTIPTGASFWVVFAVFFPAATGIMAGANMSGELKNPRKSIPLGTFAALCTSLFVYLGLSYWLAGAASQEMLVHDYTIMFDLALVRWLALAGLLAATFSSGLNSVIGASRVLRAMADHAIMPQSSWFASCNRNGIPRNAILFTAIIAGLALMLRELNSIAPLITMFFLITYATINIVILIEQNLNLISFRPLIQVPRAVPLIGTLGSLFIMFIINPVFSLLALGMVVLVYYLLMSRHLNPTGLDGDVRSSLFVSIAEWAAKKSITLPRSQGRAWRPNILIPALSPQDVRGVSEFLRDITFPSGSVNILGIAQKEESDRFSLGLDPLVKEFQREGIYSSWTIVRSPDLAQGVTISLQAMNSAFFGPNCIFLRKPVDEVQKNELSRILADESSQRIGFILYASHPRAGLGSRNVIQLWIPDNYGSESSWSFGLQFDLSLLIAYKLRMNWDARLELVVSISDPGTKQTMQSSLEKLLVLARIPVNRIIITSQRPDEFFRVHTPADLNIFSFTGDLDFSEVRDRVQMSRSTCLFCRDSSEENIFA